MTLQASSGTDKPCPEEESWNRLGLVCFSPDVGVLVSPAARYDAFLVMMLQQSKESLLGQHISTIPGLHLLLRHLLLLQEPTQILPVLIHHHHGSPVSQLW